MNAARFLLPLASIFVAGQLLGDPYVGFCYPAGLQAGTTNRFVIGGQRLGNIRGGWVSGNGVSVLNVDRVKNFPVANGLNQAKWLNLWMNGILDGKRERPPFGVADRDLAGWARHPWWETLDTLPPLEFSMVAHNLLTPRNALQMSPALAERLIVTIAADTTAKPGVRDLILFDGIGASAPRPLFVSTEPHAAEPLFSPPRKNKQRTVEVKPRALCPPIILDGQILPGETDVFDLTLDKGTVTFAVVGRELQPYLGDAVPGFFNPILRLTDKAGKEIAFADDFSYLPDPVMTADIPAAGTYRLEIRDNLFRGRDDFVYAITCQTDLPADISVRTRAFVCYPPPSTHDLCCQTDAVCQTGTISKPGQTIRHLLPIRESDEWEFELFARRHGSPLDGVLRLYGPITSGETSNAPLLATWDDTTNDVLVGSIPQTTCDPVGHWRFDHTGYYMLTVSDRIGAAGDDYRYTLRLAPAKPTFDVYTTKSSILVQRGPRDKARFNVRVIRRNGFTGPVTLEDTGDLHFDQGIIPANTNEMTIVCSPVRRDWNGTRSQDVTARGDRGDGVTLRRPVVAADEAEQAFAYTHLLPTRGLSLTLPPPGRYETPFPVWTDMPRDPFLPPRILRPNEVSFASIPSNFRDEVLHSRFAAPIKLTRDLSLVKKTYAFEPVGGETSAMLARAVLCGISRFVTRDFAYADGDSRRVRFLATAAASNPDNDIILFVPNALTNSLSGAVLNAARRLSNAGFCFDFASEALLARNAFVKRHRLIFVPQLNEALSDEMSTRLDECETKLKINVFYSGEGKQPKKRQLKDLARREQMPAGVLFSRYAGNGPDTWYFLHNAGTSPATGPWRFNPRVRANHAVAMDPNSGAITELKLVQRGTFGYTLAPGASAWIFVTPRAFEPKK